MDESQQFVRLWAKSKPRHPLWKHLLDASAISLALNSHSNYSGWNIDLIAFLAGLHDIGKANSHFQHQIPDYSEELVHAGFPITGDVLQRHERISARFIQKKMIAEGMNTYVTDAITRAIAAHHGFWNENIPHPDVGGTYAKAQNQLYRMLQQVLNLEILPIDSPSNLSAFGMRLVGHIVLCDWIASNEKFFGDHRLKNVADPKSYFASARDVACDWVKKLGFERELHAGKAQQIVSIPRPIQKTLLDNDIPPGLVIIEAPMGEGKTEAAWILAEKWRDEGYCGMYMALPTMATSDSLYSRYHKNYLFKLGYEEGTKLVHGMAWLRDPNTESEKRSTIGEKDDDQTFVDMWFRPTRLAMLATHGVGTVDQAMLAGMHVKFGFLRLYGLSSRVLVIDEIHAYDAYMSTIISRLLQWCACLEIPVILLSATLSVKQRSEMIEAYGATDADQEPDTSYPLITVAKPGKERRTIKANASSCRLLRFETYYGLLGDSEKTAAVAVKLVKNGGSCAIVLNTVKQAQAVFASLKLLECEKLLFHARFKASDRLQIAERVLRMFGKDTSNRPAKFVLVATQVVEQSLDVDFDYMISEIAPIDLLLQRSGRMHRHKKREYDPTLHVLLPEKKKLNFGGTGYVYAKKPLLRTLAILATQPEARLPENFRILIERCYGISEWEQNAVAWEEISHADQKWDVEVQELQQQGKVFALREPKELFFLPVGNAPEGDDSDDGRGWRAQTRLGANDRTAVLVREEQIQHLESGDLPLQEVRDLYQHSVKLPDYIPIDFPSPGYLAGVEAKKKLRGLTLLPLSGNGVWQGLNQKGEKYEVVYSKELGLVAGRVQ